MKTTSSAPSQDDLAQVIAFIRETDRLKQVTRKNKPLGLERFENSAEHSWQIALMALALGRFAPEGVVTERVIRMLLLHDIGEVDVGDTIVYAETGWEERAAEERAAVRRILGILPDAQQEEFFALWQEFEAAETLDARFAHAVDRAIPAILNLASQGQSWVENGISYERVVARIGPPINAGCPALWSYLKPQLDRAQERGWFGTRPEITD